MLSGFVIGRATPAERSGRAVAEYLQRRFIRIYPIYLVALVASFLVAGKPLGSGEFLLHAAFLQNAAVETIASNGPLWSLDNEVILPPLRPRAARPARDPCLVCSCDRRRDLRDLPSGLVLQSVGLFAFWLAGLMLAGGTPPLQQTRGRDQRAAVLDPDVSARGQYGDRGMASPSQDGRHPRRADVLVAINGVLLFDVFAGVLGRAIARPYAAPFYV